MPHIDAADWPALLDQIVAEARARLGDCDDAPVIFEVEADAVLGPTLRLISTGAHDLQARLVLASDGIGSRWASVQHVRFTQALLGLGEARALHVQLGALLDVGAWFEERLADVRVVATTGALY